MKIDHSILEVIDREATVTEPYASAKTIAEALDETLTTVEEHLEIMQTNGLVRLAKADDADHWLARLTPAGRREIGEPDFPRTGEASGGQGHAGAVDEGEIRIVERITAHNEELVSADKLVISEALSQLTSSVVASQDIAGEQRTETLETIEELADQAIAHAEGNQTERESVIPLLGRLRHAMLKNEALARTWATWEPALTDYFGI